MRFLVFTLVVVALVGSAHLAWSLQKNTALPGQEQTATEPAAAPAQQPQQKESAPAPAPAPAAPQTQGHAPAATAHPPAAAAPAHPPAAGSPAGAAGHGEAAGHGPAAAHGGGHGPVLPEISAVPGVTFVETMIKLMNHELHGRVLGWRPNDIIAGRFTDNINYYQLGVLEAIRFTTLRLKDSLTRMGESDTYDPDLEQALNYFMNSATRFWFPSAEGSYDEAVSHLKNFVVKLQKGQRNFYYRKDTLVALINSYRDLLGNVNKNLVASPISWFRTDDHFYYAKGVSHVYFEILKVCRVGFEKQLASTMYGIEFMDTIIHELYRAEEVDPWIILDSDLGSIFANHRANLNAPLSEAVHLMGTLSTL